MILPEPLQYILSDMVDMTIASILVLIFGGGLLLLPGFLCKLGFHDYRTIKATNVHMGKIWEVEEVCQRCGHLHVVTRSWIGRF